MAQLLYEWFHRAYDAATKTTRGERMMAAIKHATEAAHRNAVPHVGARQIAREAKRRLARGQA